MEFKNVYQDTRRAAAYATLEFPGTYYLAFRDLAVIIAEHARGNKAIDFGCGAGRSTRFLKKLGFDVVGVDIADEMLKLARERDPQGDYRRVGTHGIRDLGTGQYDLVLSAFTFDNVPTMEAKVALFSGIRDVMNQDGRIVNLVSSPEMYTHDWASFSCTGFPGNFTAKTGDSVYTIMKDVDDPRPVHDVLWPDEAYRDTYDKSGLKIEQVYRPLARPEEPFLWLSELTVAPWVIYVLGKA